MYSFFLPYDLTLLVAVRIYHSCGSNRLAKITYILSLWCICVLIDSKFEELEDKYKKEAQERKKLELELKTIQIKVSITWEWYEWYVRK